MQLTPNTELQSGKYRIIRVLGQGGFGITYLAEHTMLDKMVAIKEFFPKEYCDRDNTSHLTIGTQNNVDLVAQLKNKFIKEAKNISKLRHHNIITIHDIFQENDTAYYVMEYVEGSSLSDLVKQKGMLSEVESLGFICKIVDAVGYMHSLSMNHLDLKPANIMVRKSDGEPILIDFGLSKQYDASGGQTSTTPVGISHGFAPIEQYRPGGVATFTPQTDIYALGATLFNLLTGSVPPHYSDILEEGLPPLPKSVSQQTTDAIEHAMEVRKNKRPASVEDFLVELCSDGSNSNVVNTPVVKSQNPVEKAPTMSPEPVAGKEPEVPVAEETVLIVQPVDMAAEPKDKPTPTHKKQSQASETKPEIDKQATSPIEIGGIEFVDLGLSVRWANMNIGAKNPRDVGLFINKKVDNETSDVFEYNMKGAKVPSIGQWEELKNECSWEWTEMGGTGGYMVHGRNGNSIFLPFTGEHKDMNFRTFGRLFTRETFYDTMSDTGQYYFYYAHGGTYKCTKYSLNYSCPVRLIFQ